MCCFIVLSSLSFLKREFLISLYNATHNKSYKLVHVATIFIHKNYLLYSLTSFQMRGCDTFGINSTILHFSNPLYALVVKICLSFFIRWTNQEKEKQLNISVFLNRVHHLADTRQTLRKDLLHISSLASHLRSKALV